MKRSLRQLKIIEIISKNNISKQEEIVEKLKEDGLYITQATISRDVKNLGLVKVPSESGGTRYAMPVEDVSETTSNKFESIFKHAVIKITHANNIIVLHTVQGAANSACAFIDSLGLDNVLGSLAGDDTIITIANSTESVEDIIKVFYSYLN